MGLWSRFKRSMRALFGGIVEKTEDPERILQQTIRDMRDRVPELNNSVAQVMATEKLLAKNKERLEAQVVELDSKIKASVKMGRDGLADYQHVQFGFEVHDAASRLGVDSNHAGPPARRRDIFADSLAMRR